MVNLVVVSDTQITGTTPSTGGGGGYVNVAVHNLTTGQGVFVPGGFTYEVAAPAAPTFTSITPNYRGLLGYGETMLG